MLSMIHYGESSVSYTGNLFEVPGTLFGGKRAAGREAGLPGKAVKDHKRSCGPDGRPGYRCQCGTS